MTAPVAAAEERPIQRVGVNATAVPAYDPTKADLVKQTETTDVFANEDGTQTAVIAPEQVNFQDGLGQWQKIDNNLRVVGNRIVNGAGPVAVSFAANATDPEVVKVGTDASGLSSAPETAKAAVAKIEANTVTYPGALDGADLRYTVTAKGVREEIVIKSEKAKRPSYRFNLGARGVTTSTDDKGTTSFKTTSGKTLFSMPQGKAWDSGEDATQAPVKVSIESPTKVSITPDANWMNSGEREFPLTVDPDITFGPNSGGTATVGDTYISSANVNTNYNGNVVDKVGACAAGDENYSYIRWDMSQIAGANISAAQMSIVPTFVPSASVTAAQPIRMWHTNETWDPNTFTWAKTAGSPPQGNHDLTGMDLWGITNSGVQYNFDLTDWARNWSSGSWANEGISMDAGGNPNACWNFQSQESGNAGPRLAVTFGDPDTGRRDFLSYFDQTVDANTGLSVNLANGNLNLSVSDIQAPGVGQDLRIERNWSSLRSAAGARELGTATWQFGATQSRVIPSSTGATVYLPGMSPVVFAKVNGGYRMPAGINADLSVTGTGTSAVWTLKFQRSAATWKFKGLADGRAYLFTQADRNNNTITYNYLTTTVGTDNWPRLSSITDTFGQVTTVTYTGNVITKMTDWTGRYVDYVQSSGRLGRSEDVTRGWQSYGYDSSGRVNYIQTPQHRSLGFTFDTANRVTSITRYGSATYGTSPVWNFSYTALTNGQGTTTLTDPNGKATVYTWDASGKVKSTKDPLNHTRSQTWTPNNDTLSTTSGTGDTSTASYDARNNMTGEQAPASGATPGRSTSYQYTNATELYQPSSGSDEQGNNTSFLYDTGGNRNSSANSSATQNTSSLVYNMKGQVTKSTNNKGTETFYTYTGNRLTGIDNPTPLGDESFTYDTLGRLKTRTDGKGQVSTYTYNDRSEVTQVAFTGGSSVSYTMDADGLMTARTDAAGTWGFAYEGLRRIKTKTLPGGSTNSATYDKAGNVLTYTDPNGAVTYGYDDANNLTKLAEPGGSCSGTVSKCTTFGYDNENRRTSTNYPNGVSQVSTYDTSGRVKTLKATKGATVLTDYTYSYANTNRASYWRKGGSTSNYTYNSVDQMTNSPSFSFSYDANGAMTSSTWGFSGTYNTRGQATAITGQGGGTSLSMTYADVGQDERTQAGSTSFRTRLIGGLADETSGVTTSYIMDPQGNLIGQKKGSAQSYYLMDKLGSIVALTDTSGNLQQRFQYDPFGKLLTTSITTDSAFNVPGVTTTRQRSSTSSASATTTRTSASGHSGTRWAATSPTRRR